MNWLDTLNKITAQHQEVIKDLDLLSLCHVPVIKSRVTGARLPASINAALRGVYTILEARAALYNDGQDLIVLKK